MPKAPIQVRFIVAWQNYRVGQVIEPSGAHRDWLIAAGFCELVTPETNTVKVPMIQRVRNVTNRVISKAASR